MKLTADFETITDPEDCRVWAWALCGIDDPEFFVCGNSINTFMDWCSRNENTVLYFHNLKFDGEFILNWLFRNGYAWTKEKKMLEPGTFTTLISDKGQFYAMNIQHKHNPRARINIYDSLKIIPFPLRIPQRRSVCP